MTAELERRLARHDAQEWVDLLAEAGVPAGPVLDVAQCFANPQVQTLPVVATVEHPVLGPRRLLGPGVNLERTPPGIRSAAPEPGQHTDEVLRELGYTAAEVAAFREAGVV
jgi:formyl-CoA transferase